MWKLVLLLLLLPTGIYAGSRQESAEHELARVTSWRDLDKWRLKYATQFDDGYFAADIGDYVEKMLTDDWWSMHELARLSKRSPGLFTFAVSHLGDATSCEATKKILENAINSCPAGYDRYCEQIRRQLDTAETAAECLPAQLQPNKSFKPNPLRGSA